MGETRKLTCKDCGKQFDTDKPFIHEKCDPITCQDCKRQRMRIKNKRNKSGAQILTQQRNCRNCGTELNINTHANSIYCSVLCRERAKAEKMKASYVKVTKYCNTCKCELVHEHNNRTICDKCRDAYRSIGIARECDQCHQVFNAKTSTAKLCTKCVKLRMKKRIAEAQKRNLDQHGDRHTANIGSACESLFKYYCDINGITTYWPMCGTNPSVDCIAVIGGKCVKVQVKSNKLRHTSNPLTFRWATREKDIKPKSCDYVVCLDISLSAFILIGCEDATNKKSINAKPSEVIPIEQHGASVLSNAVKCMGGMEIL